MRWFCSDPFAADGLIRTGVKLGSHKGRPYGSHVILGCVIIINVTMSSIAL